MRRRLGVGCCVRSPYVPARSSPSSLFCQRWFHETKGRSPCRSHGPFDLRSRRPTQLGQRKAVETPRQDAQRFASPPPLFSAPTRPASKAAAVQKAQPGKGWILPWPRGPVPIASENLKNASCAPIRSRGGHQVRSISLISTGVCQCPRTLICLITASVSANL